MNVSLINYMPLGSHDLWEMYYSVMRVIDTEGKPILPEIQFCLISILKVCIWVKLHLQPEKHGKLLWYRFYIYIYISRKRRKKNYNKTMNKYEKTRNNALPVLVPK